MPFEDLGGAIINSLRVDSKETRAPVRKEDQLDEGENGLWRTVEISPKFITVM